MNKLLIYKYIKYKSAKIKEIKLNY